MCDHTGCNHQVTAPSVQQTLDELDFERGIWTAAIDGNEARVKDLLRKGTHVDVRDKAGYTALHYVARSGHVNLCRLLLSSGADVNSTTRAGLATPLHRAAMAGHIEIVKLLMKYGADRSMKDADGRTAADRATENKHTAIFQFLCK